MHTSDGANVSQISSGGMDGKIVIWSLKVSTSLDLPFYSGPFSLMSAFFY